MGMPQLSRHAATWMNEPAAWDAFVALVKRRPHLETTATKPIVVGDIEIPFAKWARHARDNEDALSDEQWAALDGVGFSWSGPAPSTVHRTVVRAPIAATTKPLVTQAILDEVATRIRNGRATVEDLQLAHRYNTNPAVDPSTSGCSAVLRSYARATSRSSAPPPPRTLTASPSESGAANSNARSPTAS